MANSKRERNKIDAKYRTGVENITISAILDPRKHSKELTAYKDLPTDDLEAYGNITDSPKIPVAIRVAYNEDVFYHRTGDLCTIKDWCNKLENSTGNSQLAKKRKHIEEVLEKVKETVRILKREGKFTFPRLKEELTGRSKDTFIGIWQDIIDGCDKYNTAQSYQDTMKCLLRFKKTIPFDRVDGAFISDWVKWMRTEGTNDGRPMSEATIGIRLRSLRVVINACIKAGKIKAHDFPFGRKTSTVTNTVAIPTGASRATNHIDIPTILKVYESNLYRRSSDLFVFSYLGGGINVADMAQLRWDDFYYNSGEVELRFVRQKTKDSSSKYQITLIPIIGVVRDILNRQASKPERGALVFPSITEGVDESLPPAEKMKETAKAVSLENQRIRKHLNKLGAKIGLSQKISPTWARHSFKTNSAHLNIPRTYTELAMAHTLVGVESNYMGDYPPSDRIKYTEMLITGQADSLVNQLRSLPKDELHRILNQI